MDHEDVRLAIYGSFARTGAPPSLTELAAWTDSSVEEVDAALDALEAARHVVLDSERRILMAHPFASIPLGFSVMGDGVLWWGGCAWDSFALPHLLPGHAPVLVATRCPQCGRALAWNVGVDAPPEGDEVAHLLVPTHRIWDDVVHACAHQSLFCSDACVDEWLDATGNERGYVMGLDQLWRLAQGWYAGRLERGYQRREPSEASDYFASVGLSGEFWGL